MKVSHNVLSSSRLAATIKWPSSFPPKTRIVREQFGRFMKWYTLHLGRLNCSPAIRIYAFALTRLSLGDLISQPLNSRYLVRLVVMDNAQNFDKTAGIFCRQRLGDGRPGCD
jgi:hypothetical protein